MKMGIPPESMAIIDGEFLRLKKIPEIELDQDIVAFLDAAHSSLKSKGALNPRGPFKRSLLHYAAMGDCCELLCCLLRAGADKDDCDQNGRTPLSWAAEYAALSSVKILLKHGANINSMDDMYSTPLSWLRHAGKPTAQSKATNAYLRKNGAKRGAIRGWYLRKIRKL
jgi:ankyrin repeat protein